MLVEVEFCAIYNNGFFQSIFAGSYPSKALALLEEHMPNNYIDELSIISQSPEWVGTNYYTRSIIKPDKLETVIGFGCFRGDLPKADMGWEVALAGLAHFIKITAKNYAPQLPHYITENGMASTDIIQQGKISDIDWVDYFDRHLQIFTDLKLKDVNLSGYFVGLYLIITNGLMDMRNGLESFTLISELSKGRLNQVIRLGKRL